VPQVEGMLAEAARARAAGAEVIIASVHCCTEYESDPGPTQTAIAGTLLASPDVDLVLGHHAHVVQPFERINGKGGGLRAGQPHRRTGPAGHLRLGDRPLHLHPRSRPAPRGQHRRGDPHPHRPPGGGLAVVPTHPGDPAYQRVAEVVTRRGGADTGLVVTGRLTTDDQVAVTDIRVRLRGGHGCPPAQRAAPHARTYTLREQKPARARRDEAPRGGMRPMDLADARPPRFPVDCLTAVREWIWRHTSQPNGDPWDSDPEHLDWAAQNLVDDLAQLLGPKPQPANASAPTADKLASRPSVAQIVRLRSRSSAAGLTAHLHKGYEYGKQRCTAYLRYVVQRDPGRRVKTRGGALA
jgi:hypothetical protein